MKRSSASLVAAVFRVECLGLLRDSRALLLAVVLPMALFPLLFVFMDKLGRSSERTLAEKPVGIAVDLDQLTPVLARLVRARLAASEERLEVVSMQLDDLLAAAPPGPQAESPRSQDDRVGLDTARVRTEALGEDVQLLLYAPGSGPAQREPGSTDPGHEPPEILVVYDGSQSLGNEAHRRVAAELQALRDEERSQELLALVGADPAARLALRERDVATIEDTGGLALGKLLPLLAILLLLSGGSFAALGAFAGEREAGTVETLFVQPVPALSIALGKFLAVLVTATAALVGNALSLLGCMAAGLGDFPEGVALGLHGSRLALGLLVFAPTVVLGAALLCFVAARAKSFREGQHYVFPLVLIGSVLAAPASQEAFKLTPVVALLPVTGGAMALRDTLAGNFALVPSVTSFVVTTLAAGFVLRHLAWTLDAERVLGTPATSEEASARRLAARRALSWGWTAVVAVYLLGGWFQAKALVPGLLATLWLLVPILALLAARSTARLTGEPLARVLGLTRPQPAHLIGALGLAPGLAWLMTRVHALQERVLPMPEAARDLLQLQELQTLPPAVLVFLLAVSPGWNEELLFRGALLSGLRRDLRPARVCLWQGLLFGAVHASVFRFVPTALIGVALAALTLRARSIFPAVLLHAGYNACLVLELIDAERTPWWALALATVGLGLVWCFRPLAPEDPR